MNDILERELIRLEQELMEAVQCRDMALLERSLGREFVLITGRPGAERRNREEWLAITQDRYVVDSFTFEDLEVHVYGHTGLVRSRYRQTGRMDDQDRTTTYLMTDVWVWREWRWQIVSRHLSALDPPGG